MQNSGITKSIFLLDRVTWHYSFIIIQSDNMISVSGFLGCVANCRSSEQPSASLRCLLTTSELGRTTGWEVLQLNSKDTQSYLYYMWTESWRGRTGNELGELGWRFPQGADGCISKETRVLQELRPGDWKICDYKQQVMKVPNVHHNEDNNLAKTYPALDCQMWSRCRKEGTWRSSTQRRTQGEKAA